MKKDIVWRETDENKPGTQMVLRSTFIFPSGWHAVRLFIVVLYPSAHLNVLRNSRQQPSGSNRTPSPLTIWHPANVTYWE